MFSMSLFLQADLCFVRMPGSPIPGFTNAVQVSVSSIIPAEDYEAYLRWMVEAFVSEVVEPVAGSRFDWGALNSHSLDKSSSEFSSTARGWVFIMFDGADHLKGRT